EAGRPVLVPVLVPAVFVANRSAPGENAPVVGLVSRNFVGRVGWVLEHTNLGMVSHYLVVVGYDAHRFAVVEPVRGYRTITFDRLERYRRPYADAALVLSGTPPARPRSPRTGPKAQQYSNLATGVLQASFAGAKPVRRLTRGCIAPGPGR